MFNANQTNYNFADNSANKTPKSANASGKSSKSGSGGGLPGLVAQGYYKHGLFLSSYPTCAASLAIVAILFSCYPLINGPLPGTIPTRTVLPFEGKNFQSEVLTSTGQRNFSLIDEIFNARPNLSSYDRYSPWAHSTPAFYVQQITLRASVLPWTSELQLMDAFRTPLYEVFKLLDVMRNHESNENQRTLDKICLRVENVKRSQHSERVLPEHDCLVLSPANLWTENVQNFIQDTNILNTIFQYHNLQKTKVSTAEMLFGLPMRETGFKRCPKRNRSRIIQFSITMILKQHDVEYIRTLKEKLLHFYPPLEFEDDTMTTIAPNQAKQPSLRQEKVEKSTITHIFYPDEYKIWELVPLVLTFVIVFVYVYLTVRKIDVLRSHALLACCSVVTIIGSLIMSLGVCYFFGLTISLQSKDVFPYLVILVGLENSLVITKTVVSMQDTFDTKIRIAKALSKEGWHFTQTLLTEITILTIGLSTFVPVIQEFCVFAIVGLLSDFMLQMLLFSTILAMNIKRAEYTTEVKHLPKMMLSCTTNAATAHNEPLDWRHNPPTFGAGVFHRSQSHPKLSSGEFHEFPKRTSICNGQQQLQHQQSQQERIPKRIRLVNFWTRTRFFQRAFMIWMIMWIGSIIYNSGLLEQLFTAEQHNGTMHATHNYRRGSEAGRGSMSGFLYNAFQNNKQSNAAANSAQHIKASRGDQGVNETNAELRRLLYPNFELNYYLSDFHWSSILNQYNISLHGKYVTILPAIKLSYALTPQMAAVVRNPYDQVPTNFQWKALAAALDPLDFDEEDEPHEWPLVNGGVGAPLVPKSPMEIFFAVTLGCISVFVLCYSMVVFYRCICTKNYAEWRSSWNESSDFTQKTEHILEGVPTRIAGHKHNIECLISDGMRIISCCLKGQIKAWDVRTGETLMTINRSDMQIAELASATTNMARKQMQTTPIWSMDYYDNLIAVGCANGRVELWESPSGTLKCSYQQESKPNQGITHIKLNGDRLIVARLCGRLDFYRLETYYKGRPIDWGFTSAYRRTHVRTGSTGSLGTMLHGQQQSQEQALLKNAQEEMKITLEGVRLAHQQPITCMAVVSEMVFTGSQDHTLKVYCLDQSETEYTLHGHCGPITCLFVDRWQPSTGGSGSQDGQLCVWDLQTGACMYNIQAHDGSVSCLVYAPSYVISLGTDERICVWERFQGNLLTAINISNAYSSLLMLTPSLLVTSKMGSLIVWDVRTGEPAREVKLDFANMQLCPKIAMLAGDSVVCDYGNEIRVVRFPIVADKSH